MAQFLVDEELRESKPGDEVRASARARTLAVLEGLDAQRKGSVVRFLWQSDLITTRDEGPNIPGLTTKVQGWVHREGESKVHAKARTRESANQRSGSVINLNGADLSGVES